MNSNSNVVVIRRPETSNFVVYGQSTTSQFITYKNESSVIPSSLDQIMKNNVLLYTPIEVDMNCCPSTETNF